MFEYDVFLSHASEDKDTLVRPLAQHLEKMGLCIWYDEFMLRPGDSLRRSIDKGLGLSRLGVVILSQSFFKKEWPQKELDALVSQEATGGQRIIPVWHNLTREEVAKYSPLLADRIAISTVIGVQSLAWAIRSKVIAVQSRQLTDEFLSLGWQTKNALLESVPADQHSEEQQLIKKSAIRDRRTYVREVLNLLNESQDISVLCMDGVLPYIFYGATKAGFRELRELECEERATMMGMTPEVFSYWEGFWRAYRAGKTFRYAVSPASVKMFERILVERLEPVRANEILSRIEADTKLYSVDIRLVSQSSPFCMFITRTSVLFALISPRVSGLVAHDVDLIGLYQQMFDLSFSSGTSVQKWIAEQKKLVGGE